LDDGIEDTLVSLGARSSRLFRGWDIWIAGELADSASGFRSLAWWTQCLSGTDWSSSVKHRPACRQRSAKACHFWQCRPAVV